MSKITPAAITRTAELARRILTFYATDREVREAIKTMTDEQIISYADEMLDRAETKNNELIATLEENS